MTIWLLTTEMQFTFICEVVWCTNAKCCTWMASWADSLRLEWVLGINDFKVTYGNLHRNLFASYSVCRCVCKNHAHPTCSLAVKLTVWSLSTWSFQKYYTVIRFFSLGGWLPSVVSCCGQDLPKSPPVIHLWHGITKYYSCCKVQDV